MKLIVITNPRRNPPMKLSNLSLAEIIQKHPNNLIGKLECLFWPDQDSTPQEILEIHILPPGQKIVDLDGKDSLHIYHIPAEGGKANENQH